MSSPAKELFLTGFLTGFNEDGFSGLLLPLLSAWRGLLFRASRVFSAARGLLEERAIRSAVQDPSMLFASNEGMTSSGSGDLVVVLVCFRRAGLG